MGLDLLEILWVNCVEDVEEVVTIRLLAAWVFVLEMNGKERVILELRPKILHRKLIPMRDVDVFDGLLLQHNLFIGEDLLEEDLVDLALRRQVILCCKEIR